MKKLILLAIGALTLTSCRIDENIDPNNPQVDDLTPKELLAAAQTSSYDALTTDMMLVSNVWMNCWSGNEYYFAAPLNREYQMNVTATFRNGIWDDNYLAMANLATIINNPSAAQYPHHVAIAKILLANSMQYIVDFYGDVPYTEAFQGLANTTPKYDDDAAIYKDLIVKLNEAIASLDLETGNAVSGEDVIFHGDTDEWKKLANTIKLRILLRQSKVTDGTIRSFVDSQLQGLANAEFVSTDVTINPGYSAANEAQQNPLYREYGWLIFDDSAQNTNGYRLLDLSDHFAKLLVGTDTNTGIADPRGTVMYRPVGGTLKGIVQGGGKVTGGTESGFSRLRWKYYNYASVNSSMDGYVMLAAESELLQAEAAVLYPSIFSGADAHYVNAVNKSFEFFGLNSAPSYLASLNTQPYGWNGSKGKIAAIQYQRMVALNLIKPQETYINYLKTGYPETPLALTATHPNKPWRLVYPSREYNTNSANVPNITEADVFVKNQYTPFWNQN